MARFYRNYMVLLVACSMGSAAFAEPSLSVGGQQKRAHREVVQQRTSPTVIDGSEDARAQLGGIEANESVTQNVTEGVNKRLSLRQSSSLRGGVKHKITAQQNSIADARQEDRAQLGKLEQRSKLPEMGVNKKLKMREHQGAL